MKIASVAAFALVAGGILAVSSAGVSASQLPSSRKLAISTSGLPGGRTIDVWSAKSGHKLASLTADVGKVSIPSNVEDIRVSSQPVYTSSYSALDGHVVYKNVHPGTRYVPSKPKYRLSGVSSLQVRFVKQHQLNVGASVGFLASPSVKPPNPMPLIHINSGSGAGWYDAGATLKVAASNGNGLQFAYWQVYDATGGHTNTSMTHFSGAQSSRSIVLNHPTELDAMFVSQWKQLAGSKSTNTISVGNIFPGQRVKLVQKGNVIAQGTPASSHQTVVDLRVPSGKTFPGRFVITAPDGKTVIFTSPIYANLRGGNRFYY